ncbi:hypothetical protein FHS18_000485 [Paenibacillus phyllosphaerae]|uniref:DUF5325 family protein n=1 Tax=Paenibacillus phyllosphaerae TaxID=274593 RepID=A0A7W5ATN2_9BACL|nr:DUF5325 family protein [Paenibacillus phyllosphaerae]MBB3108457.1 hypothetical protein [Paenibacillus phyllosphaerae]
MSKPISLLFAIVSVLLMTATGIAISYNAWLTLALFVLTMGCIGYGFVLKAKLRRRAQG